MRWIKFLSCILIGLGCSFYLGAVSITVGSGTNSGYLPMNRTSVYATYESIITQTELAYAGNVRRISFEKASGSDTNPIQNVTIYLKHTTATELVTGVYSTTGYTQVYAGSFTNDVTSGWMSVLLSTPFTYNNVDNLQILIVKGMQTVLTTTVAPRYTYTSTTPVYRTRFATSNTAQPTNLTCSYTRSNIRLEITGPPVFAVAPTAVDFGQHNTSDIIAPIPVTVSNTGEEPLQIVSLELIGDTVFTLNDNNTYPIELNQGDELLLEVAFAPINSGAYNAELVFTDDQSRTTHIVYVSGSATRTPAAGTIITPVIALDTVNPLLSVITPNGGETLYSNQQKAIEWSAADNHFTAAPITIEFSADNGSIYTGLATNQSNTGSYLWTVPTTAVQQAKIRIIAIDSFGNTGNDESDAAFTLAGSSVMLTPLITVDTTNPTVDLQSPNGGENWYIGETHDILWTASDSHIAVLPIKLEYKKVSQGTWITIQPELSNTGAYAWQMPSITSTSTIVRLTVKDVFGNTGIDISQNPFSIGYVPPAAPQNVDVQIVNSRDAVITWSPVTQTILGTEITPSAYLVLYNQTSDSDNDAAYYYLGENETATGYTHYNVARRAPRMFYRVVAVMDYDGRLSGILAGLNRPAKSNSSGMEVQATDSDGIGAPVSWIELKRRLAD